MKTKIFTVFPLVLMILLNSCASNQVAGDYTASNNKKTQGSEKLRYVDWKYRGFGKTLPLWLENALTRNIEALKKTVAELQTADDVIIVQARGENSDQAEQIAKSMVKEVQTQNSDYIVYDSFWVCENLEPDTVHSPYISVYIVYK